MSNHNVRFLRNHHTVATLSCLCLAVLLISSCTPLRKKFTRKKKSDEQSKRFIPVLEPVDYPELLTSPSETYQHHYSLWKIWEKELLQTIDREGSDKRQRYLLDQTVEQLSAMNAVLHGENMPTLDESIAALRAIYPEFDKPASMRNLFSIKKKIERNSSRIRREFAPGTLTFDQEP